MNKEQLDRLRGTLWGQAIGDAFGLMTEFMTATEVAEKYPKGLNRYSEMYDDSFRSEFANGEWTDDTEQMLCILASLVEHKAVIPDQIGKNIYAWGLNDGRGMGRLTSEILTTRGFKALPWTAAHQAWLRSGMKSAPNGALMRTSIMGCWHYWDASEVAAEAERVCAITHADPRCKASSVAVSLLISHLICHGELPEPEIARLVSLCTVFDEGIMEWYQRAKDPDITTLDLDGTQAAAEGKEKGIGYTYKTFAAGVWALLHASNPRQGIRAVSLQGGDADTNACVAGALLGAKFGLSRVERTLIEDMPRKDDYQGYIDSFVAANGEPGTCSTIESITPVVTQAIIAEQLQQLQVTGDAPKVRKRENVITVMGVSQFSEYEYDPRKTAVISINSPGCSSFCQMPPIHLELEFSDLSPARLGLLGRLLLSLEGKGLDFLLELYWKAKANDVGARVVPFRKRQARQIHQFIYNLPDSITEIIVQGEDGRYRSAAVGEALMLPTGFDIECLDEPTNPNTYVRDLIRQLSPQEKIKRN